LYLIGRKLKNMKNQQTEFRLGFASGASSMKKSTSSAINMMDDKPCLCSPDGKCEYNKGWNKCRQFILEGLKQTMGEKELLEALETIDSPTQDPNS
jgi:hypothetical protein